MSDPIASPADPLKSAHADLLNRLSEMQDAPYYATARSTLAQAERVIVELEAALAAALPSQRDASQQKAERYDWLRDRFLGADFEYGENDDDDTRNGRPVLLISFDGKDVWGDLDLTVDAAILATKKEG